jgi:hypothetical protein
MRSVILFGIVFSTALQFLSPTAAWSSPPELVSQSCNARDNLDDLAVTFISRCCKASIYREFPSELLFKTLGEIQRGSTAAHKKAWKLLNDNRFKK